MPNYVANISGVSGHVLAEVEAGRDALARFVSDAIQVPSITGNEGAIAEFMATHLEELGFEVAVKPVEEQFADRYPALRGAAPLAARPNVFATWRAKRPGRLPLVLNGHTDVIPAGAEDAWTHAPFGGEIADGKVWGRGAMDMKGGIAAGIFALRALRATGVELPFDVQVQCVIGEESGGLGTLSAIDTEPRPQAAIVLEATACRVTPACGGAVIFEISTDGKAAHTGLAWIGVSAFEKLTVIYEALRALAQSREQRLDHPLFAGFPMKAPFGVGTFNAGEWIAMIPATASMTGRLGVLPGEDLEDVRQELVAAVEEACRGDEWLMVHPATISWPNNGFPAWETRSDHPVIAALRESLEDLGADSAPEGFTGATDAGHFARAGVPAAVFGPGMKTAAHLPDEHVSENQLVLAAKTLALAITRLGAG